MFRSTPLTLIVLTSPFINTIYMIFRLPKTLIHLFGLDYNISSLNGIRKPWVGKLCAKITQNKPKNSHFFRGFAPTPSSVELIMKII
jgi:hypothetical protein